MKNILLVFLLLFTHNLFSQVTAIWVTHHDSVFVKSSDNLNDSILINVNSMFASQMLNLTGGEPDEYLRKISDTSFKFKWYGADTIRNDIGIGSISLTDNFTTSSTSAVNTNLTFPIKANEKFEFTISGTAQKAGSATGMKIAISAPVGCTIKGVQIAGGNQVNGALIPSLITAINTLGDAFATGNGVEVYFEVKCLVKNGSTAGNITLHAATVTNNTATIFADTKMSWSKVKSL